MSKKGLHGHYDRLTPEERFRLDVLAMARGDSRESERLVASCPRSSYTMNEVGFVERWRGAIEMTLRVYIPLGEQLAKLQMIDAFRVFVPYSQTLSSNMVLDAYYKGHEAGSRHAWATRARAEHRRRGRRTGRKANSRSQRRTSKTPPWSARRTKWRRWRSSTTSSCRRCWTSSSAAA